MKNLVVLMLGVGMVLAACQGHRSGSSTVTVAKPAPADPAKPSPKVAVKAFSGNGIPEGQASTLTSSFCTAVINSGPGISVLCYDDLAALISDKGSQLKRGECQEEMACLTQIAEVAKADLVIHGTISRVGESFMMQASLIDAHANSVKARFSQEVSSSKVEDLLPAIPKLAEQVAKELKGQ